jgi:hypothetical protein
MKADGRQRMHNDTKPGGGPSGGKYREVDLFSTNEAFESEFWQQGTSSSVSTRQLLWKLRVPTLPKECRDEKS